MLLHIRPSQDSPLQQIIGQCKMSLVPTLNNSRLNEGTYMKALEWYTVIHSKHLGRLSHYYDSL